MVIEDAYRAVLAENAQLKELVAQLQAELAAAREQIAVVQAKQTPPPSFVKANVSVRPKRERKKRAAEHNHARRREEPTQIVEHPLTHCPDCGSALGGVHEGRRRQVLEVPAPPPPPVAVIEHRVQRGWCSACGRWREAPLDLAGQVVGPGRAGWQWGSRPWSPTGAWGCACRCAASSALGRNGTGYG